MRDGQTVDSSNQVGKNKPKTAIDMFRSTYQKSWNLEYNKRAFIKNFDSANQLTETEQELMKEKVSKQILELEDKAHRRFDSNKNWSIMIQDEQNELRNEVMRRTKSNQIKIRSLQNLKWKARAEIMQHRKAGDATTQASSNKELKGLSADVIQNVLKDEITEYVKSMVTKSNVGSIQSKP